MQENDFLDWGFGKKEDGELVSVNNFIILFFLTMGLYGTWWMYKAWRYFKEKDNLDIMPPLRAIFDIFFLFGLFERIQTFAQEKGYTKSYSSGMLFIGFILLRFLTQLPEPMWVISQLAFICLVPPFRAFNFAMMQSEDTHFVEREGFSQRQLVLVVVGTMMWALVIFGLIVGE